MKSLTMLSLALQLFTVFCASAQTTYAIEEATHAINPKQFRQAQNLGLGFYDQHLAVYYDDQANDSKSWPLADLSAAWAYTQKALGKPGDTARLQVICYNRRDKQVCFILTADDSSGSKVIMDTEPSGSSEALLSHLIAGIVTLQSLNSGRHELSKIERDMKRMTDDVLNQLLNDKQLIGRTRNSTALEQ